jgi:NAD(P)-dependent dehydrogenase (short-subunit alcohol dehydrogenase family)
MRVLLVGATGAIGTAILEVLEERHEVLPVSLSRAPLHVDIGEPESIRELFKHLGALDAIVAAAGSARFKPLSLLSDEDFEFSLRTKLMGQVNLIRYGLSSLNDEGSITITTGLLAQHPILGSAALSLVNAGLEGFMRSAALEAPRGIRINAVSPPRVREPGLSSEIAGRDGLSAHLVAQAYLHALEGTETGQVLTPWLDGE